MNRITILTGPLGGHGGEETVLREFIELLSDGYNFDLIISEQMKDISWIKSIKKGLSQYKVNESGNRIVKLNFILNSLRKASSPVVICLSPRMVFLSKLAKKVFRKKYTIISWVHFNILTKYTKKTANLLTKADYHLAISSGIKQELISLGIPDNRISLIYNPVQRHLKSILPSQKETKFLCVSRIEYKGEKNLCELFLGLSLLKSNNNWSIDIYGSDDSFDEQETKKCKALVEKLNLVDHVNWKGWKKKVWKDVYKADCVVMTSTAEGFPMVLCEAISYGIPVIASDCPTGPSDIVNCDNGFLYTMGNINDLSEYLDCFVEKKYDFNSDKIKSSIEKMYIDTYQNKIEKTLNDWID